MSTTCDVDWAPVVDIRNPAQVCGPDQQILTKCKGWIAVATCAIVTTISSPNYNAWWSVVYVYVTKEKHGDATCLLSN